MRNDSACAYQHSVVLTSLPADLVPVHVREVRVNSLSLQLIVLSPERSTEDQTLY